MSGYQEEKNMQKRHPSYTDYNPHWDYLNAREGQGQMNRRGMSYGSPGQGHTMGWNPMGIPQGPYFNPHDRTHMMPAHAHSGADYNRYNQWNNPKMGRDSQTLQNAHSRTLPGQKLLHSDMKVHTPTQNKQLNQDFNLGFPQEFSKVRSNPHDLHRTPPADLLRSPSISHPEYPSNTIRQPPALRTPPLPSHPKPVLGNPLTDLQLLVTNQDQVESPQRNYQQETVDLSAHSETNRALVEETVPDKDNSSKESDEKPVELVAKPDADVSTDVNSKDEETEVESASADNKKLEETSKEEEDIESEKQIVDDVIEKELALIESEESQFKKENESSPSKPINLADPHQCVTESLNECSNSVEEKCNSPPQQCEEKLVPVAEEAQDIPKEETEPCNIKESELDKEVEQEHVLSVTNTDSRNDDTSLESKKDFVDVFVTLEDQNEGMPAVSSTSDKPIVRKTQRKRQARNNRRSSGNSTSPEPVSSRKKKKVVGLGKCVKESQIKKKKSSELSENLKRGPIVRVEGSRDNPVSVAVVNMPKADDDDDKERNSNKRLQTPASRKKIHHNDIEIRAKARNGLFSSTLSSKYDAHSTDHTWICVFCKKGPHYRTTGDLFGPYLITKDEPQTICDYSGDEKDITDAQKRGGRNKRSLRASNMVDHFQKMSKKLKRTQSSDVGIYSNGMSLVSCKNEELSRYEVWVHEVCAVWAAGVYLIGTRLLGLQDAIWSSVRTMCSRCGEMGANIGCVRHNCANRSHYACAQDSGWLLNNDTFIATCHVHRARS